MRRRKICLLILFAALANACAAQTIYKNWLSEKSKVCLMIREVGFNSSINEMGWIKFRLKKDNLKIVYNYSHKKLGRRLRCSLKVIKLTNDTLILAKKSIRCNLSETLGADSIIILKAVNSNCYENGVVIKPSRLGRMWNVDPVVKEWESPCWRELVARAVLLVISNVKINLYISDKL